MSQESSEKKKKRLSYEEKLKLMLEYMEVTGKKIASSTIYKGYNIGIWKANMRQLHYGGKLKMDPELLKKFKSIGIIREKRERIRTSQQEKYEFLMELVDKSKVERRQASMKSGLTFDAVRHSLQLEYNRGQLKLMAKQIEDLKNNGFLKDSPKEQERITQGIELPRKYVLDIMRKYGSYEEFIRQYKSGAIDYEFGNEVFCGYKGVTISEQEMTVQQKLRYIDFAKEVLGSLELDFEKGDYIDIDILKKCIEAIPEQYRECIKYYLNGEKCTYKQIGEILGLSVPAVDYRIKTGMCRVNKSQLKKIIGNVQTKYQQNEKCIDRELATITDLKIIKAYVIDENGRPKGKVSDISLEKLGVQDYEYVASILGVETKSSYIGDILKELCSQEEERKRRSKVENETFIEECEFSDSTFRSLKRANINTVSELVAKTEEDLKKIRGFGPVRLNEVKQKLEQMGLQLGQEINRNTSSEPHKSDIEILFQRCNDGIDECMYRIIRLQEFRREKLDPELARYEEAKDNYLKRENIFDPKGVVPAVKSEKEEKNFHIDSGIELLEFSLMIYNSLKRANINTIYELVLEDRDDLLKLDGMEQNGVEEIERKLAEHGLQLGQRKRIELILSIISSQEELKNIRAELDKSVESQ